MGGARVTTLVTLRKCTLGNKREIKTLKFVSASTKGFKGGLAWIKPSKKDMAVTFSYSRGMRGATSSPHGAAPTRLPTGTGVLRRAQPATSDGMSRHHSTSRTTLTILATTPGAVTQTRHPNDPKRTTREGARQTDRHEHEHSTTELEQRPGPPMGSTGTHRGGPAGPCHRRECTYEWHKRNWKYGYGAPRNTG